jgi:two-component system cell cycle response regulator
MRALIADDDRITTTVLAKTLQSWQVHATVAHDGRDAWKLMNEIRPSLAIIDWMMPEVYGPELCRRIRQEPSLAHMYVILLTGRNSREDLVAGLDAGADDYIVKPFDRDELRARVQVGLRVARLQERLSERVADLQKAQDELARLASTDALTGLYSRRRWFELANAELTRYHRYDRPLSLLMLDIDHFKDVNDLHGHEAGDEVLRRFAELLRRQCRQPDVPGRVGGEEFAMLLPETAAAAAAEVARRITEQFRLLEVPRPQGLIRSSCSIGVAEATPGDDTVEAILRRADLALYQAKRNGRDRVELQAAVSGRD